MKRAIPFLLVCAVPCTLAGVLVAQPGGSKAPPDQAILIVKVPADAKLSIGEQAFKQTGPERTLITPSRPTRKPVLFRYQLPSGCR